MIKKVVFIGYQPLTKKVLEDFYFQELLDNNFEVAYWDLTKNFFNVNFEDYLNDDFILKVNTLKEFENQLRQIDIKSTLFHLTITFEYRVIGLYSLLSKYNCKTSFFGRGVQPDFSTNIQNNSFFLKFYLFLKAMLSYEFIGNKYAFLLKKIGVVKHYSLVFKSGEHGMRAIGVGNRYDNMKSKIIEINSFDFEKFIKTKHEPKLIDKKYCVYLDEYLPFHPDFELFNMPIVNSDIFYNSLNIFFNKIEKDFNIDVIIAAHPKALKYKTHNFFGGRDVIFNKSAELTKDAEFILFHCSSSVSFAILNNKTILSLNSNSIKNQMPNYYNTINCFSKKIDSKIINIDEKIDEMIDLLKPNNYKYKEYIYSYLTSKESENFSTSQLFINTINSYL
jgi:hypothetical protein